MKKKAILAIGITALFVMTGLASATPSITVETTDDGEQPLDLMVPCFGLVEKIECDGLGVVYVTAIALVVLGPPFIIINKEVWVFSQHHELQGCFIVALFELSQLN